MSPDAVAPGGLNSQDGDASTDNSNGLDAVQVS